VTVTPHKNTGRPDKATRHKFMQDSRGLRPFLILRNRENVGFEQGFEQGSKFPETGIGGRWSDRTGIEGKGSGTVGTYGGGGSAIRAKSQART
jgi:hypothetical protein